MQYSGCNTEGLLCPRAQQRRASKQRQRVGGRESQSENFQESWARGGRGVGVGGCPPPCLSFERDHEREERDHERVSAAKSSAWRLRGPPDSNARITLQESIKLLSPRNGMRNEGDVVTRRVTRTARGGQTRAGSSLLAGARTRGEVSCVSQNAPQHPSRVSSVRITLRSARAVEGACYHQVVLETWTDSRDASTVGTRRVVPTRCCPGQQAVCVRPEPVRAPSCPSTWTPAPLGCPGSGTGWL
jgi:hypothetical protein